MSKGLLKGLLYPETLASIGRQTHDGVPGGVRYSCGCEERGSRVSLCEYHQGVEYGIEIGRDSLGGDEDEAP